MERFRFNEYGLEYYASDFEVKVRTVPIPEKSLVHLYISGRKTNREDFMAYVSYNVIPEGVTYMYHKDTLCKRFKNWRKNR